LKFQPDSDGKPQPNFIDDGTGKPVGIGAEPNPCLT